MTDTKSLVEVAKSSLEADQLAPGTTEVASLSSGGVLGGEGSAEDVSSNEEDDVVKERKLDQDDLIPIPPPVPKSGISMLTHKLWIGNLDKRLTE